MPIRLTKSPKTETVKSRLVNTSGGSSNLPIASKNIMHAITTKNTPFINPLRISIRFIPNGYILVAFILAIIEAHNPIISAELSNNIWKPSEIRLKLFVPVSV